MTCNDGEYEDDDSDDDGNRVCVFLDGPTEGNKVVGEEEGVTVGPKDGVAEGVDDGAETELSVGIILGIKDGSPV